MTEQTEADRLFDLGDEHSGQGARALQAGHVKEGHECFREAITAYRAAFKAAPEDDVVLRANLNICIGAREFGLGNLDAAAELFEDALQWLRERPDLTSEGEGAKILTQARLNRADHLVVTGAREQALAEVQAVLADEPGHPYALHLLVQCGGTIEEKE